MQLSTQIRLAATCALLAAGAAGQQTPTLRIVVGAASGGEWADGAIQVADLDAALDAVRAQRAIEKDRETAPARIEVLLGEHTYERQRPLSIDAAAGGSPGAPTVLRGVAGRTRIVGARTVPPAALSADVPADLLARLPSDAARAAVRYVDLGAVGIPRPGALAPRGMGRATVSGPTELFWNDRPLPLARWPNAGYAELTEVVDAGTAPRDTEPDVGGDAAGGDEPRGGVFRLDDPRVERWVAATGESWALGYWHWDWADELLPIARVDPASRQVTLGLPHHYGLAPKGRFAVINVLEELDRPGECVLLAGRDAMVVWPPATEADATVFASILDDALIQLRDVEHLVISGIELGLTRGAAVRVDGGAFVGIEDCRILGTGAHGVVLRGLAHRVARCRFEDIGAAGVTVDGGDRATLTPGGHVVEDCEFTRFGRLERTYRPAIALSGVGHRASHNLIHDGPHAAILVAGNEHVVEGNEISRVLLETGDCGAIYLGRDWAMHGVVIRHNLIHDLPGAENRWQNAIYLDDMASGITVEGNVLWRCNLGMLIGGGRSLTIRHNVLIDCTDGIRFDARGVGWMAKNIADPATSTLHQRLAALPVDSPPWSVRYPEVQRTLTVGFGRPVGSRVIGNAFFRTPFGKVEDAKSVQVDSNRSFDRELDPTARPALDVGEISGFPAIPVGEVGPRQRR